MATRPAVKPRREKVKASRATHPVLIGMRRIVPKDRPKTVRDIIRRHLALDRLSIKGDLANMLGMHPVSAAALMGKKYAIAPQYIDRFITEMKLDEFDAHELRLAGAIEAGWQLHKGRRL